MAEPNGQGGWRGPVTEAPDMATAKRRAQQLVDRLLAGGGRVALEAGCGSASHLRLDGVERLVGIDISPAQLERNGALDERVLGDLETHRFPAASFDLIVAWDVLEHLDRPVLALENLVDAARPGGLVILAVPNLQSVKGLVAKFTPHWVHTAVQQGVYPDWPRDVEDVGPFPTKLRRAITVGRLVRWAEARGLRVREAVVYESHFQRRLRQRCHLHGRAWAVLRGAVAAVSARRVTASGTDLLVVLEVPQVPAERVGAPAQGS